MQKQTYFNLWSYMYLADDLVLTYLYMCYCFWLMVTIVFSTLSVVVYGFPLPSKALFFLILFSVLWQDSLIDVYVFWEFQYYIDLLCSAHLKLRVVLDMYRYPENINLSSVMKTTHNTLLKIIHNCLNLSTIFCIIQITILTKLQYNFLVMTDRI